MQSKNVKYIMSYYQAIPGMLRLLEKERRGLDNGYNGLRGVALSGMPRGAALVDPTEMLGMRAAEDGIGKRLAEIEAKKRALMSDAAVIRGCLDALNGQYKQVLYSRYIHEYSWYKISIQISVPDSTVRNWHDKALKELGGILEKVDDSENLVIRASYARM